MKIGLIDADLIDHGTRHPNLALLKLSGYYKAKGYDVTLLTEYNGIVDYDKVFVSKVFSFTLFPEEVKRYDNVSFGGSGFYPDGNGPDLPNIIEHHMPDYSLYEEYIKAKIKEGVKASYFNDYRDFSIGFMTRGCFRKCEFCINKKYDRVFRHSSVKEFLDHERKYIYLWDDNVLGYEKWNDVFDELSDTGKYFQFRQGLDIRVMTPEKAEVLSKSKYYGDYIFAFDDLAQKREVVKGLKIWKKQTSKTTKLYLLCAYKSTGISDIEELFERISILMKFQCLPYVMRYENYKNSKHEKLYTNISRWCNQPHIFKKMSFREFSLAHMAYVKSDHVPSALRTFNKFMEEYPDVAKRYVDLKYMDYKDSHEF